MGACNWGGAAALVVAMGVAGWFAWTVMPLPWIVVAFGRQTANWLGRAAPGIVKIVPEEPGEPDVFCTYVGEGTNVWVAVTMSRGGSAKLPRRRQIRRRPCRSTCGCSGCWGTSQLSCTRSPSRSCWLLGVGVTAGTFVVHPDVNVIVICDIEPLVPTVVMLMFGKENYHVVDGIARQNPHTVNGKEVEVIYDDGRHFLRTTPEKFDIITSDPDLYLGRGMCRSQIRSNTTRCAATT